MKKGRKKAKRGARKEGKGRTGEIRKRKTRKIEGGRGNEVRSREKTKRRRT